jgi:fructoselysine-6-P-deglycase FrlB-like protein
VRAGLDLIDRFDHVGDEIAAELSATPVLHVLGSGAGVAGAREGAVIFKEGPGVPAEALTAAEWLHGAYRAVRPGRFTALLLLGSPAGSRDGEVRAKVESLGGAVVEIGPLVVGDPALGLPGVPRSALPLVEGLALELWSLAVWESGPEATS